jgi:phosphatidate cytidylyltransferase
MPGIPDSLPIVALTASLCGALAMGLAGLADKRQRPASAARRPLPGLGRLGETTGWSVLAVGAAAPWFGAESIIVLFAIVSVTALAGFLALDGTSAAGRPLHVACCYLCVPLQYGFVAAGRYDWFAVVLPLITTLAIPLLTIAQGESRALLERVAERQWGVMVWVYLLSHAPALLILAIPGVAGGNAGLVSFLVVLAFASQWLWSLTAAPDPDRAAAHFPAHFAAHTTVDMADRANDRRQRAALRRQLRLCAPALLAMLGALLSSLTPFSPGVAAAMALLIAVASFLGCFALAAIRGVSAGGVPRMVHADALAFAAPAFFYAVRGWIAW